MKAHHIPQCALAKQQCISGSYTMLTALNVQKSEGIIHVMKANVMVANNSIQLSG